MPPSLFTDTTFLIVSAFALIGLGAFLAQNVRRLLLYMRWIFIGSRCFGRVLPLDVLARTSEHDVRAPDVEKDSDHA